MKKKVSKEFCIKCKKYIEDHLDMRGGGGLKCFTTGLYKVDYCYRASKFKIFRVNVALFFMWLFRPRKFKEKSLSFLGAAVILGIVAMFYVGILLGIMYELLLATGG